MPMDIPEWRNVDRHLFETQILPAGRPAVFKGAVDAAAAQVAELETGDAIFIPYMWWHSVRSLTPFNVLINYWWNSARRPLSAPFLCLLHGRLRSRTCRAHSERCGRPSSITTSFKSTEIRPRISRVSGADCSEASRRNKRHNPQPHWRNCRAACDRGKASHEVRVLTDRMTLGKARRTLT